MQIQMADMAAHPRHAVDERGRRLAKPCQVQRLVLRQQRQQHVLKFTSIECCLSATKPCNIIGDIHMPGLLVAAYLRSLGETEQSAGVPEATQHTAEGRQEKPRGTHLRLLQPEGVAEPLPVLVHEDVLEAVENGARHQGVIQRKELLPRLRLQCSQPNEEAALHAERRRPQVGVCLQQRPVDTAASRGFIWAGSRHA